MARMIYSAYGRGSNDYNGIGGFLLPPWMGTKVSNEYNEVSPYVMKHCSHVFQNGMIKIRIRFIGVAFIKMRPCKFVVVSQFSHHKAQHKA